MAEMKKNQITNIEKIKSLYNIKEVFSFLNKRQKLNMIIYNKQIQNIIGVNIEDYKKMSGKYKIIEKNGFGKEYQLGTNILIFEGKYINGKRNGKVKEYNDNGNLRFEGEYLNGELVGKGKGYYNNGNLHYEGQYLNGKRNGKWKEYYDNGKLEFIGEYLNGKRNGKAKEYYKNGNLKFEGEYLKGKKMAK